MAAPPRRPAVSSTASSSMVKRPAPPLSRQSSRQPLSTTSPNAVIQSAQNGRSSSVKPPLMKSRSVSSNHAAATMPSIHSRTSSSASVYSSKNNNNQGNSGLEQHAGNDASTHSNGRNDSDASQGNIKVVVRCRGANARELAESSDLCITTSATRGQEVLVTPLIQPSLLPPVAAAPAPLPPSSIGFSKAEEPPAGRNYSFDNVFGEQADQAMLYGDVVQPILDEVLLGYNCTIFAYGQTGTGKTYTMEGDLVPSALGTFSPEAGIIPRTLHRLFHMLEGSEFTLRVSFMELYNEELRDLNAPDLSNTDDLPTLRIFDDASRKGGVVVQGQEETHILSADQGIRILTRGSQRRQSASTRCNDQSSRSHSIFTITIHLKETSNKGEDLLKVGKLNLVDLAGSENVGRSGAVMGRAREAGMINQSLLTLGRVINALVEKSSHVPYRESKLTRLLQDSLGGRTKTCIIATISPARINLEETQSTLDYAARAKSIRNKPEVNSRMTKAALLSQYAIEIERLKADVLAAREKNGIYLSAESWNEISSEHEKRKTELGEAKRMGDIYQSQLRTTREQFEQALRVLGVRDTDLKNALDTLEQEKGRYKHLDNILSTTKTELNDETALRKANESERKKWKDVAGQAVQDVDGLWNKIARKVETEEKNAGNFEHAHGELQIIAGYLETLVKGFEEAHMEHTQRSGEKLKQLTERQVEAFSSNHAFIEEQLGLLSEGSTSLRSKLSSQDIQLEAFLHLVETTSQEMLLQSKAKQNEVNQVAEEMYESTLKGCEEVVKKSGEALKKVVQAVKGMHASANTYLEKQIQSARQRREQDVKALQEENDRLRAQNAILAKALSNQQEAATRWQAEFITSLTAGITAFNTSQHTLLKRDLDQVQTSLQDGHNERASSSKARTAELQSIDQEAVSTTDQLRDMLQEIEDTAMQVDKDTPLLGNTLQQAIKTKQSRMTSMLSAQEVVLDNGFSMLQKHCTNFDEARKTHSTALNTDLDELITATEETYRDIQEDMQEAQSEITVLHGDLEVLTSQYDASTSKYCQDSTTHLDKFKKATRQHLKQNVASDYPTGQTPVKRPWPEISENDEPLDGNRYAVLEHIRTGAYAHQAMSDAGHSSETEDRFEENGVTLAGAGQSKAPRMSSAIAARKAARRSSVLTATTAIAPNGNTRK